MKHVISHWGVHLLDNSIHTTLFVFHDIYYMKNSTLANMHCKTSKIGSIETHADRYINSEFIGGLDKF